jgi:two-component system sensor histidine kinase UhpB
MLWLGALFLLSQHNYYLPIGAPLFSCLLTGALAISARQINDARALRTAEERYALAVRGANDGLWDWSLQTNEIYYSPRWKAMLGYREDEIGAAPEEWFSRVHSSDRVGLQAAIALHLNGQVPHFQCEHRLLHRDGVYRWVLARGLKVASQGPASSRPSRMAGSLTEITERKRSEENLSRSHEQLRALAARVESAQEEERMRIAREIHDELGQALTGLKFDVRWLRRALEHSDHASVHVSDPASENLLREKVDGMSGQLDAVIESVQAIATQLRPSVLDHLGLEAAIEWRAQDFEDRTGITCEFASGSPGLNVEGECATGLFRICQEALTNVARHAMASRVWISLQEQNNELVLEIRDNGRGIRGDEEANRSSLGLLGMRERALALGGSVEVTGIPGHGTTVRVRVPMSDHIDERNVSGNVQRSDCEQDPHAGG